MEKFIRLRLGGCRIEGEAVQGFAAAGALAATGKLLDVTRIFINARSLETREHHRGYTCESVLSTTLPILTACKDFSTVIYMTSRAFSYSDFCSAGLLRIRAEKGYRTIVVRHIVDDVFEITCDGKVDTFTGSAVRSAVEECTRIPMCCIICDWPCVTLYDELRSSVTAAMWWYPMQLREPLESSTPGESTSYYVRAFAGAEDYCMVVGGYGRLRKASDGTSAYLSRKWLHLAHSSRAKRVQAANASLVHIYAAACEILQAGVTTTMMTNITDA